VDLTRAQVLTRRPRHRTFTIRTRRLRSTSPMWLLPARAGSGPRLSSASARAGRPAGGLPARASWGPSTTWASRGPSPPVASRGYPWCPGSTGAGAAGRRLAVGHLRGRVAGWLFLRFLGRNLSSVRLLAVPSFCLALSLCVAVPGSLPRRFRAVLLVSSLFSIYLLLHFYLLFLLACFRFSLFFNPSLWTLPSPFGTLLSSLAVTGRCVLHPRPPGTGRIGLTTSLAALALLSRRSSV